MELDYWMKEYFEINYKYSTAKRYKETFKVLKEETGMRTGEAFALTWDDIDLENKIIKINKTVYSKIKDDKGRWFLGTTKTNDSCREVFICDTLYKILSNYKEKQKLLKKKYGRKYKKYEVIDY